MSSAMSPGARCLSLKYFMKLLNILNVMAVEYFVSNSSSRKIGYHLLELTTLWNVNINMRSSSLDWMALKLTPSK